MSMNKKDFRSKGAPSMNLKLTSKGRAEIGRVAKNPVTKKRNLAIAFIEMGGSGAGKPRKALQRDLENHSTTKNTEPYILNNLISLWIKQGYIRIYV